MTDGEQALVEDGPQITWEVPEEFWSIGLEYLDEEREEYLRQLGQEIFPGGGEERRALMGSWYKKIAEDAENDGAVFAHFCVLATEDDRVSSASLVVRSEPLGTADAQVAADGIQEIVSQDSSKDVHQVASNCGPVVTAFSGVTTRLPVDGAVASNEESGPAGGTLLEFAVAEAYCPLPRAGRILIFNLSTPTPQEFPWYVYKLGDIVDTVSVDVPRPSESGVAAPPGSSSSAAHKVQRDFG
ncbi:hypothetical protein HCC61_00255 [Streptomyces sp. HNM0575]|uniref:hypothetical protein n=1 Tax=Streptomyces sp. HNM0575 TaxID=2716338 RepID=UPI00145E332B|nr:hypothetical protein [Streptomyces sp. HNM0575]NLU71150.1 hypothetical protein [Streptomyces sp. HNM0575]